MEDVKKDYQFEGVKKEIICKCLFFTNYYIMLATASFDLATFEL